MGFQRGPPRAGPHQHRSHPAESGSTEHPFARWHTRATKHRRAGAAARLIPRPAPRNPAPGPCELPSPRPSWCPNPCPFPTTLQGATSRSGPLRVPAPPSRATPHSRRPRPPGPARRPGSAPFLPRPRGRRPHPAPQLSPGLAPPLGPAPPLGRLRARGQRVWGSPRAGSGGGSFPGARGEERPHAGRLRRQGTARGVGDQDVSGAPGRDAACGRCGAAGREAATWVRTQGNPLVAAEAGDS